MGGGGGFQPAELTLGRELCRVLHFPSSTHLWEDGVSHTASDRGPPGLACERDLISVGQDPGVS